MIFWSFVSAWCFYRAQRRDQPLWYFLAGIFLGLAFFSKFFAGLLGLAYVAYLLLFVRRGWRPYLGILLIVLGTLPFIGLNLYWNYTHCWDNYLFNLQNRTSDFRFSLITLGKYLLLLLVVVTPPVLFYLWRSPAKFIKTIKEDGKGLFLVLFLVPILLFLLIALGKTVGGHWILSFYPFLFVALAAFLNYGQLRVCFHFMWGSSLIFLIAFIVLILAIPNAFKHNPETYQDLIFATRTSALLEAIKPFQFNFQLATTSYSQSSVLAYWSKKPVMVLGLGSHHGRQDDMLTDLRKLHRQPIMIISQDAEDVQNHAKYFGSYEHIILPFEGTQFHLGVGTEFNYPLYRDTILVNIRQQYYAMPSWLPKGQCYMDDRYGAVAAKP